MPHISRKYSEDKGLGFIGLSLDHNSFTKRLILHEEFIIFIIFILFMYLAGMYNCKIMIMKCYCYILFAKQTLLLLFDIQLGWTQARLKDNILNNKNILCLFKLLSSISLYFSNICDWESVSTQKLKYIDIKIWTQQECIF